MFTDFGHNKALHITSISLSESWSVWFVVFLMIASLIWFLVNCSCSAVTSRLHGYTGVFDVSDRSIDDSACGKLKLLNVCPVYLSMC